jgi:Rrf2 family protein
MILSQKSEYAVRAVLELAKKEGSGPVKAAMISSAQSIPVRFLENILGQLRQAGIVDSVRGKEGGYLLGRPAT